MSEAYIHLAEIYEKGDGVARDEHRAYALYSIAAASGHAEARASARGLEKKFTRFEITAGEELAKKLWDKIKHAK